MPGYAPSEELHEVIGEALGQALELLDDDALIPFVYSRARVCELDPGAWLELAAEAIQDLPGHERCWVLVALELEPETGPGPCLHVRAGERGVPDAFMFEQHFRERGIIRGTQYVGDLVLIGECENPVG